MIKNKTARERGKVLTLNVLDAVTFSRQISAVIASVTIVTKAASDRSFRCIRARHRCCCYSDGVGHASIQYARSIYPGANQEGSLTSGRHNKRSLTRTRSPIFFWDTYVPISDPSHRGKQAAVILLIKLDLQQESSRHVCEDGPRSSVVTSNLRCKPTRARSLKFNRMDT